MTDTALIKLLKASIVLGICLSLLGVYFHLFAHDLQILGLEGIIISATCVALGMLFSLPTKIYLTFLLMKAENEQAKHNTSK